MNKPKRANKQAMPNSKTARRNKPALADYLRRITPENIHREIHWAGPVGREVW